MLPIHGLHHRLTLKVANNVPTFFSAFPIRYFSDTKVIFRLINNLLYHKDFQFPAWTIED